MAPLLLELSSLEVEPLETVGHAPESGQERSLETLITAQGEVDPAAFSTDTVPTNADNCCSGPACCCCCVCCCT